MWERLDNAGTKAEREVRRNKSIEAAHAAAEAQRKAHVERLKKSKAYADSFSVFCVPLKWAGTGSKL